MSYGLVICDLCHREVHQGDKQKWFHCEDKSPRCAGAMSVYPKNVNEIVGKWCGADDFDHHFKKWSYTT